MVEKVASRNCDTGTLATQNDEEKEVAGGHRAEDISVDGHPEAKRMCLRDGEHASRNCGTGTLATQNDEEKEVAGGHRAEDITVDGHPEAKRMCLRDDESIHVDETEGDLQKLKEKRRVQNAAAARGCVCHHNQVPVGCKQHQPFVQYTRALEDKPAKGGDGNDSREDSSKVSVRSVARKSTPTDCIVGEEEDTARNIAVYKAHQCAPECSKKDDLNTFLGRNPLSIPCLLGWKRCIVKRSKKSKRRVVYIAPCMRRLRDITEVAHFLNLSKSPLTIELFSFDSLVNVFCEFVPEPIRTFYEDISYNEEKVAVTSINSIDDVELPLVEYSSNRYPGKGVNLNLDPNFLCGCDCEDDCQDRDKCSCQQLTIAATEALKTGSGRNPNAGYLYRRLPEPHLAGVYECNSQCHCSHRCYNRVVQNGLRARLQVFKTKKCGWGIRCLNDLPKGSFIFIYSGELLNEQAANEDGKQYGDEYLAELDHIEVVEKQKEGYESDVVPASDDDSDKSVQKRSARVRKQRVALAEDSPDRNANDDEDSTSNKALKVNGIKIEEDAKSKTSRQNSTVKSGENESCDSKSTEDKPPDAAGNKGGTGKLTARFLDGPCSGGESQPPKLPSTRSFFNEEFCYVINAKHRGNIGRYLNHSCSPNLFVQNVFVDTHDLRYPWVAFFAAGYIKAGVELTWDYGYDVGSVPGRVIYCCCKSDECRGRLL